MTMPTDCLMCRLEEDGQTNSVVFSDPLWAAQIVPGYDVPGWFILRARRHAELLTGLDEAELATFAQRARNLITAVREATGAPATYLLTFGENYKHFHALIAARGADVPPERRNGDILKLRTERADPAAAALLLPAVRSAYELLASPVDAVA
jgi:diadenosine tetraphosphate (Ap4A) HIT family hydrolase